MEEFLNIPEYGDSYPFTVILAGISYCDKNYYIRRDISNIVCIESVLEGIGTIKTRGEVFHPKKGDTYMLVPGEGHEYYSDPEDPWVKIWFVATGSLITPLLNIYELIGQTVFHCDSTEYIEKIHSIIRDKSYLPHEIADKTSIVFHELLQHLKRNQNKRNQFNSDAEILKNYIDVHVCSKISIDELSDVIHKSTAQTIRTFKKGYKQTPYEYHLTSRISKAVVLLKNTNLSIKEIAYQTGFDDEHYFSNLIKSKTGKRPSEYRKSFGTK